MFFGGTKSSDKPHKGISVPDHELFRSLATGAYGQVWLARNVLGGFRAVKIVQRETFQHERQYEREFEGVRNFEPVSRTHPGFVQILHVGRDNREGFFYYVMELADDEVSGREVKAVSYRPRTLRSDLDRRQHLPDQECARLGLPILAALDHLHQLGLVHRDIKPANFIFVGGQPKFADIGLVAAISGDGTLVGSIGYNAPEGSGGPAADIFSLGRVLFEMFTGVAVAKCGDTLPDVTPRLKDERERRFLAAVLKACAVRVEDRWRGAAEFYDALVPFAALSEDAAVNSTVFPHPDRPPTRLPAPVPVPGNPAVDVATMLEPAGGAVPLKSRFYIERAGDRVLETALARRDGIVRITGARQMGKTSLIARGLQQARLRGWRVVMTDLQKANVASLQSLEAFYGFLGESLADQLDLDKLPRDAWDDRRSANTNFERWFRREVLGETPRPLLWELDEVDRLFGCPFSSEVFGLFRSWYNDRALSGGGVWDQFTLAIAYATEVRLFIHDEQQSPFNVGTLIELADFTPAEGEELNRRYGGPLKTAEEHRRLQALLGGQPFLTRCALNEMVASGADLAAIEGAAEREEGLFAEHLRRLEHVVGRHPELPAALRAALEGRPYGDARAFHRLRAVGLVVGTPDAPRMRCELYARHFRRRGAAG